MTTLGYPFSFVEYLNKPVALAVMIPSQNKV